MANKKKLNISEVVEITTQMIRDGQNKRDLYQKIDDAVDCVFEPDEAIKYLPFIQGRHIALTDIADARNSGTRTFSSRLPDVRISPVADNEGEYDRVEKQEQAWKWEIERMNRPVNGQKGVHDKIVQSAITYHAVTLQTEYLPYKFKGMNDSRIKQILNRKCFNWTVHHPGSVESKYSDYGLETVVYNGKFTAQQLVENFGESNEGISKFLSENAGKKKSELMKLKFTLYDFMDSTYRVQYISAEGANAAQYILMNEKHGLPFIPWVIVDYGDPLWQAVIESGTWNNLQHMALMRFSKSVAVGMHSDYVVETPDGKLSNIWIDYKNPTNPVVIPSGSKVVPLPPSNLDPGFEQQYGEIRNDVSRSTVARILQDPTPYIGSPFSSLNAAITTALGQLSPAQRVAEAAEAEAIYQGFQWIKHSKIPFVAYRKKSSDGKIENQPYKAGASIYITHEDPPTQKERDAMSPEEANLESQKTYFDLQSLYVGVELKATNVEDEQAKLNLLLNAQRSAGMPAKEIYERMGWQNYEENRRQRAEEALFDAELQNAIQMKQLPVQRAFQQMQLGLQQQARQAQLQQQMNAESMMNQQNQTNQMNAGSQFAGMEGVDMRRGGMPASRVAPNETRETITGRDMGGGAIP